MFWLLLALLTGYALRLPLTLRADIHHQGQTQARIQLRAAGLHKTWQITGLPGAAAQLQTSRSRRMLALFRRADTARRYLLSRTRLERLDALVLLRTADAARTALLIGMLRPLAQLPCNKFRICVQPDFFRPSSTVQIRCIIRWKLGTLLLTSMMLLAAYIRQRITESEA